MAHTPIIANGGQLFKAQIIAALNDIDLSVTRLSFESPQALIDDTSLTNVNTVEGQIVWALYPYERAASGATDNEIANANGVKFRILDDITSLNAVGAPDAADPAGRIAYAPAIITSLQRRKINGLSLRDILGRNYSAAEDGAAAVNAVSEEAAAYDIAINDPHGIEVSCESQITAWPGLKLHLGGGTKLVKQSTSGRLIGRDTSLDSRDTSATVSGTAGGFLTAVSTITAAIGDKVLIRHLTVNRELGGVFATITAKTGTAITFDHVCRLDVSDTCHLAFSNWADEFELTGGTIGAFDDDTKGGHLMELFGSGMLIEGVKIRGHYTVGNGGAALHIAGDNNLVQGVDSYTVSDDGGCDGLRLFGGRGNRFIGNRVVSADDAFAVVMGTNPDIFEYDWDVIDNVFANSWGYSRIARVIACAIGGPQNLNGLLGRNWDNTFYGVGGLGGNRCINVENTEGTCWAGQMDRISIIACPVDGSRQDATLSQGIAVDARLSGGVGQVTFRDSSLVNNPRSIGLDINAEGATVLLDNCHIEGETNAIGVTGVNRLIIKGGEYAVADAGGGNSPSWVVHMESTTGAASLEVSERPTFNGVGTSLAAIRMSSSTNVARIGAVTVNRLAAATSVIAISHASGATFAMDEVFGDFDTIQSGSGKFYGVARVGNGANLTIASGSVTLTHSDHWIDTEAAAASDDLDTVVFPAWAQDGQMFTVRAASSARDVVIKDGTGNIRAAGDFTMTHVDDVFIGIKVGSLLVEIGRSDNAT